MDKNDLKAWVCGFLFSHTHHETNVALIMKERGPAVVVGMFNGIGGKIEPGEEPHAAMVREFKEEAGVLVPTWRHFCDLRVRTYGTVQMYTASLPWAEARDVRTREDEIVRWLDVRKFSYYNVVPNLRWLIPMALDADHLFATVEDPK